MESKFRVNIFHLCFTERHDLMLIHRKPTFLYITIIIPYTFLPRIDTLDLFLSSILEYSILEI